MATHRGDSPRTSIRVAADAVTMAIRPVGGASARSSTRTSPAHHRQVADMISRPLGFTTELKKTAVGVTASSRPTRRKRFLDQQTTDMIAKARKRAPSRALMRRIRYTPVGDTATSEGSPTIA